MADHYTFNDPDCYAVVAPPPRPAWWRWAVWAISSQFGLALSLWLLALWGVGRLAWWEAGGLWLFAFGAAAAFALDDRLLPPGGDPAA